MTVEEWETVRGYCEKHKLIAVLDGFDRITQHFGDVVERLDSLEEKLAGVHAELRKNQNQ